MQLTTRLPEYTHITATAISTPTSVTPAGLNKMTNHLLALDPPKAFQFLVAGKFLHGTLGEFMDEHEVHGEEVLQLEFVLAMPPPLPGSAALHEDWVSSVSAFGEGHAYATGCYDGLARMWRDGEVPPSPPPGIPPSPAEARAARRRPGWTHGCRHRRGLQGAAARVGRAGSGGDGIGGRNGAALAC